MITVPETAIEAAETQTFGELSARPGNRLGELRARLTELGREQRDISTSTRELALSPDDSSLLVGGDERYSLSETGFTQLAAKLQIPSAYLRRCDPALRSKNVNRWLREQDRGVLIRLQGDSVRAVLSTSYGAISHLQLLGWLSNRISEDSEIRYELSPSSLEMQVIGQAEVGLVDSRRDLLNRSVSIRNSEVGLARLSVSTAVYRQICMNGLVLSGGRWAYHRRHVGSNELVKEASEAFDKAISLSAEAASAFAGTRGIKVGEPAMVRERIVERYSLTSEESQAVEVAFEIEPGDTLYHCINSLTRAANDRTLALESRTRLQELGGTLTELSAAGRWIEA